MAVAEFCWRITYELSRGYRVEVNEKVEESTSTLGLGVCFAELLLAEDVVVLLNGSRRYRMVW